MFFGYKCLTPSPMRFLPSQTLWNDAFLLFGHMINVFLPFPSNKGSLNLPFGSTYPSLPKTVINQFYRFFFFSFFFFTSFSIFIETMKRTKCKRMLLDFYMFIISVMIASTVIPEKADWGRRSSTKMAWSMLLFWKPRWMGARRRSSPSLGSNWGQLEERRTHRGLSLWRKPLNVPVISSLHSACHIQLENAHTNWRVYC